MSRVDYIHHHSNIAKIRSTFYVTVSHKISYIMFIIYINISDTLPDDEGRVSGLITRSTEGALLR